MTTAQANQDERMRELFEAIGIKGELQKTARRYLRSTPEYAVARSEGRAREWITGESVSMGEYLYLALSTRPLEP